MIHIHRADNYETMSRKAADLIFAQILLKPDCVLGLATGSSPVGIYRELVKDYAAGRIDFTNVTSVNLDEYRGLSGDHPQSYRYFMNEHLFDHVNIDKARTFVPDGLSENPDRSCADYDALIDTLGGIDLQLLGIGHNGHIGFNEPGDFFAKGTHCVTLSERTIEANKRFFASAADVPKQAFSMGIQNIMQVRKIVLVASGADKAEALHAALYGEITPRVPASILQLHPEVHVFVDEAAISC